MLREIIRLCESAYPREACGIVTTTRVFPAVNVAHLSDGKWIISPAEITNIFHRGFFITGFYVAHCDDSAEPNENDLECAHWPGYLYAIVSVRGGLVDDVRCYRLGGIAGEKHFIRAELDELRGPTR